MNTILAVEASTFQTSVAIQKPDGSLEQVLHRAVRPDSTKILLMIDYLLGAANAAPGDVDGFAVGAGPGSFTGLRVAYSVVKTFAMQYAKPVLPVSAMDAIAASLSGLPGTLAVAQTARKGFVYAAVYHLGICIREPAYVSEDALAAFLDTGAQPRFLAGNFAMHAAVDAFPGVSLLTGYESPEARHIAGMGQLLLEEGGGIPAEDAVPLYLRASEAEEGLS